MNQKVLTLKDQEQGTSLWADARIRLFKNKLAVSGLIILAVFISLCALAPWIAPYEYQAQNLDLGATPPSWQHWFGTDKLGRDLFSRVLYGGQVSFMVGFIATFMALCIGVMWGAISGFAGGRVDMVMMRIVDTLYALPFIIFIILLMVVFGRSMLLLFLAIGAVEWLTMARIVRGQVQTIRQQEYIEAAIATGLPTYLILWKHVIPNTLGTVIIYATLTIPQVMLLEAFLSFLGLGVQPPESSWGILISYGAETMEEFPWLLIFPGLALSITLFAFNFLGDGLRDALDPRASKD